MSSEGDACLLSAVNRKCERFSLMKTWESLGTTEASAEFEEETFFTLLFFFFKFWVFVVWMYICDQLCESQNSLSRKGSAGKCVHMLDCSSALTQLKWSQSSSQSLVQFLTALHTSWSCNDLVKLLFFGVVLDERNYGEYCFKTSHENRQ